MSLNPAVPRWRLALGSGVSLVTITVVLSTVMRLGSSVVLTRLLSPEDFGAVAITAAILAVIAMVSDLGFTVFIVQHPKGDDPRLLDVIWTIRLVRSVILTIAMVLLAGPFATLIGKPELTAAIAWTSLHFIVEGIGSLSLMTVIREQKLFKLSCVDIASTAVQIALGILFAMLFKTYWALIVSGLLGVLTKSILSYTVFTGSRRRFAFERRYFDELMKFGRTIVGAHTIQVLLSQVDKFVLSRLFSLYMFGLYSVSSNLAGAPSAFTSAYPSRVLLPAFARAQREAPERLRAVFYETRRSVMLLYVGAMGGFIGFAPAIIEILYDPRYAGAGTYLQILAIAPLIGLNNYAAREVLIAVGQIRPLLVANLVRLSWLLTAGAGGYLALGPLGLVVAVGTIEVPVQVYNWYELRRNGLLRIREELAMLAVALSGVAAGLAAMRVFALIAH